jgi:LysM repeat protein
MTLDKPSKPTKLCPTCGTRIPEDAARCLVCGADLSGSASPARPNKGLQGSRMPEITLSLPAVFGLLAMFLIIGAGLVWAALGQGKSQAAAGGDATPSPTVTMTLAPTYSPTAPPPTITNTPEPSPTPQSYTVQDGDLCGGIAFNFGVSIPSIVLLNNLPSDCGVLLVGQKLLIPYPTATPTALPTSTLSPADATEAACKKVDYIVQESDTLSKISLNYAVPVEAIREYNGLVSDVVRFGQKLVIPLCRQSSTPGPTPTATLPPPYPAPNLLLPADGAPYSGSGAEVALQWASVGTLRQNESYAVTIEDVTEGQGRRLVEYMADTKFIVPDSFRPNDTTPHVIRWWVVPVRQTGTDMDGNPIWEAAGAPSAQRVFTWYGQGGGAPAATPQP